MHHHSPPPYFKLPEEHHEYGRVLRQLRDQLLTDPDFHSCAFFTALFEYALTYGESLVLSGRVTRSTLEVLKGLLARNILEASRRVEQEQNN